MKNSVLFLGAALLFAAPAVAGEKGDWDEKMSAKFEKIDSDGNGSVTEAEYMAHKRAYYAEKGKEVSAEKAEKMSAWFSEASGGDGALTLAEMKESYKAEKKKKKDRKS